MDFEPPLAAEGPASRAAPVRKRALREALARIRRMPLPDLAFAALAWPLLGLATLCIRCVAFRRLSPWLGTPLGPVACTPLVSERQFWRARLVKRSIRRAARFAPFRSDCLPQAFAASALCRLLGIPTATHLGVKLTGDARPDAHAWVCAGPVTVTGGPSFGQFEVVGCFLRPRPLHASA